MAETTRFGISPGPYRLVEGEPLNLPLARAGVNVSVAPSKLEGAESPNIVDVRVQDGGVSSDFGLTLLDTAYAGAGDKTIIGISEFQRKDLVVVLVRHRPTAWDRWNGAAWLTLGGALTGIATDRLYSVVMQDKLVVANRVDKLKYWDGQDANAVADLSADSPIAHYIAPFGQRLVAARIKTGGSFDPYKIQWSADGNIQDWTNANNGAGSVILEPEGKTGASEFIKGLSALEVALAVYRERSIVLGTRTGIGSQPFRWATVVFGLGTDSPYSIANGGMTIGDFFLGNDLNVYLFDGRQPPKPIGNPIYKLLRAQITDVANVVGVMDRRLGEYWLRITPNMAWVFNVREFLLDGKLSWRRRTLANYNTVSFGQTKASADPVVNSVPDIVDTVGDRVDEFGITLSPTRLLFGDSVGGVSFMDEGINIGGVYETRQLGMRKSETLVGRLWVEYSSEGGGVIEVSVSSDGGNTFTAPIQLNLAATAYANGTSLGVGIDKVMPTWFVRLRIVSGQVTIYEVIMDVAPAGSSAVVSK